jgi:hypothetical protein
MTQALKTKTKKDTKKDTTTRDWKNSVTSNNETLRKLYLIS